MDFGLAKLAQTRPAAEALGGSAEPTAAIAEEPLTSPGLAVGTVAYMSPEQARGEELNTRTDQRRNLRCHSPRHSDFPAAVKP